MKAKGTSRLALVNGRLEVPDFDLSVVCTRHYALPVEAQTAHEFLVALEHPDAVSRVDVPDATTENR